MQPGARRASGCTRRSARRRRSCPGSRAGARSTSGGRSRGRKYGAATRRSRRAVAAHDLGPREERLDPVGDGDRTGAGAAAAVRLGERLVQVEVDDVEAHVPGPADAHDRVQVRAVVVERRADAVDDPRDLLDPGLEQAERRRVGEHQAGDVLVGLRAQVVEVDVAVLVGADLDHLVAGHRHRRRVRAVRRCRESAPWSAARRGPRGTRASAAPRRARRATRRTAAATRAADPRSPPSASCRRHISSSAPCARRRVLERMELGVARAARRPARAAWGCASSCTSRAGRSRCRGRSCASTAGCSGGRSRARQTSGSRGGSARRSAGGSSSSSGRSGTSSAGATNARRPGLRALEDRQLVVGRRGEPALLRRAARAHARAPASSLRSAAIAPRARPPAGRSRPACAAR